MTVASDYWMDLVVQVGCVVCSRPKGRSYGVSVPPELHHVAEGSGKRSDFSVVPLCLEHNRGASGLHGLGVKKFVARYRPPGESEWGLLVWTNQLLAEHMKRAK